MRDIKDIVIHCSATPDGDDRFDRAAIDRMHKERGWSMIGYHFVIEIDGKIVDGRPLERIGAHVQGSNAKSIGICMIGTKMYTLAQWVALGGLVGRLHADYPGARIQGHRDFSPDLDGDGIIERNEWVKDCPNFDVIPWFAGGMQPIAAQTIDNHE